LHTIADPHKEVRPRRRTRKGSLLILLILAALVGAIIYPPTFLFAVRQVLAFEALRYGFHLSIGRMDGSVADPIRLYNARLSHNSEAGTSTMLEIDEAHTTFGWRHLFWQRDAKIWHDLNLDGVRGTIDLPSASQSPGARPSPFRLFSSSKPPRLLLPSSLTISHANILIRQGGGTVRLEGLDLQASDVEAGHLVIGALSVQEPWMTSVFSNCRGSLLLQDSKLVLANMKLTDALSITSASADLPELLRGQLQMEFALDAFSGNIQGELRSRAREQHLDFESSGTFANISVAQLAAFFSQDADGSIKQGKFTFRGSPRDLAKATFTTRFEAGAFRWGARRWNSLVAGATYVHHHLESLQFQLTQAHNSLLLKGDMNVPENWNQWWKTDFNFDVAAKIDNLSELSALLGPGFEDIFGKLTVDGAVSGDNASFNGQLIVSGSHLSFRKAPLDELQAAIKLQGNEIQVTNAEFTHGDDFLRGHGVVNILGEKRYWGEIKASVADLSLYASFLQPPIAPEAFGGGLMLDWSGDGAQSAHSGAFTVRLNHVRPLSAGSADAWQPIDVTAEATYSPDSIFFSNLVLGDGETTLASRVVANPSSLTLQNLKLLHGKSVWLAGDAQIPLNVWAAWQNPGAASWWNFESPCKLDLKLDRLSVHDTLLLSGRQQPFDGELTGNLKSDGTLAKLTAAGHLVIKNAAGTVPDGTLKAGDATLDFNGSQLSAASASGDWNGLAWSASGAVTAPDVRTPSLDLAIKLPTAPLSLGNGMDATAALDLRATGQLSTLAISGTAQLQSLKINRSPSLENLVGPGGTGLQGPLPALTLAGPPAWKLNVQVIGNASVELAGASTSRDRPAPERVSAAAVDPSGIISPTLEISGSLAHPAISGSIAVKGFSITEGPGQIAIAGGAFFLNPVDPAATSLVLRTSGVAGGAPFDGYIFGTLAQKHFTWSPRLTAILAGSATLSPIPASAPSAQPLTLGTAVARQSASPLPASATP
jgi:hypothetical protein